MAKGEHYKSTLLRIRDICEITKEHYEVGNQAKCYHAVWRKHIEPKYGICYRTYLKYIATPLTSSRENEAKPLQLTLFD